MKTNKWVIACVLGLGLAAFAGPTASAQPKDDAAALQAKAKVTPDAARKTALAKVAGTIKSQELEEEGGKLVYSFDIKVAKKSGIDEVLIDAISGDVISVSHEDAKAEAQEKLNEKAEHK